jgi:hypothetical protein
MRILIERRGDQIVADFGGRVTIYFDRKNATEVATALLSVADGMPEAPWVVDVPAGISWLVD